MADPVVLDLGRGEVRFGERTVPVRMPAGARSQLVTGTWHATRVLLEAGDAIEAAARRLPYVTGY